MSELLERLRVIAKAATPGPWFTLGQPWLASDLETQVMSGSPDPHVAEPICDFLDASTAGVEDKWEDDDWSARNWANALHIATFSPDLTLALLDVVEAAREYDIEQSSSTRHGWAEAPKLRQKWSTALSTLDALLSKDTP